jgi:hypothetical protein
VEVIKMSAVPNIDHIRDGAPATGEAKRSKMRTLAIVISNPAQWIKSEAV